MQRIIIARENTWNEPSTHDEVNSPKYQVLKGYRHFDAECFLLSSLMLEMCFAVLLWGLALLHFFFLTNLIEASSKGRKIQGAHMESFEGAYREIS